MKSYNELKFRMENKYKLLKFWFENEQHTENRKYNFNTIYTKEHRYIDTQFLVSNSYQCFNSKVLL